MDEIKEQKCNYCKVILPIYKFSKNRACKYLKSCDECRVKQKKNRDNNKCEHGIQRSRCKECDGSEFCEHNRRRSRFKECDGSEICDHNRRRESCKDCMNNEEKIEFIQKRMISNSRVFDKKHNLYDPNNFIDKCFLEGLFEDSQNCHYCDVEFTYNKKIVTFVTIERLNNSIGHIKSNCVLACWDCNSKHKV